MNEKITCIIPCAGFGTRVGMKPHEAKELLPWGPNGQTLIDHKLELCKKYNLEPLIITRPEKQGFIEYLYTSSPYTLSLFSDSLITYTPTGEWTKTLHDNRRYFGKNNILVLPDTIFNESEFQLLVESSDKLAFLTHAVEDPHKWGILFNGVLYEKPNIHLPCQKFEAWGAIKFSNEVGRKMFKELDEKKYFQVGKPVSTIETHYFEDLTR